jgi:hypothetical protein
VTKAICFKCGAFKFGAFNQCFACYGEPLEDDEILISLVLTDHDLSEEELLFHQKRIQSGSKIVLNQDTKNALNPTLSEIKRIIGERNTNVIEDHFPQLAQENNSLSLIPRLHSSILRRKSLSLLLFHLWRTSFFMILILSVFAGIQGNPIFFWNPILCICIFAGTGYSFTVLLISKSDLKTKVLECRGYFLFAVLSIVVFYFVNRMPWSIPFLEIQISSSILVFCSIVMGICSALRGDFDSAL